MMQLDKRSVGMWPCVAAIVPRHAVPQCCGRRTSKKVRIIQTNSAGDNVHIIDPATNKVVGVIEGIEVNHGAGAAPDGSRIYISDEAESTLDVVDAKTLKVMKTDPAERPSEQHGRRQGRPARLCRRSSRSPAAST